MKTVVDSISTKSGFCVDVIFSSEIVVVFGVIVDFVVIGVVVLLSNSSVVVLEGINFDLIKVYKDLGK